MEISEQRLVNVRFAPKADIRQRIEHVCFVPLADIREQPGFDRRCRKGPST
jgi:hypothetical protein